MEKPISEAVILMAGSGSRLVAGGHVLPKPLIQIAGRPVFSYLIDALQRAGIETVHIVTGRNRDELLKGLEPLVPGEMKLHPIHNPEWHKQNGISVLAARSHVTAPFFLTMGDHLFQPSIVDLLLREAKPTELNVAIDRKVDSIFDLDDAMKVQTHGDRVVRIGKDLPGYDAIDTGAFVCPLSFFDYLEQAKSRHAGSDCSLADGVSAMAKDEKVRAIDIGDGWWQDIDTPEMLAAAEKILGDSSNLLTPGPAAP
ncbi:MAG TPA: NTP transferase domain-containing protein [Chthoniobacterales bacterium]|nr:NTP transferase domain-containing protein [Chthoniobacterales bacterium]